MESHTTVATPSTEGSVSLAVVEQLLEMPLLDLVFAAAAVHREHHDPARVQCSQLLSIKTGGCPEDCGYCSQSAHHKTPVEREPLLDTESVLAEARAAKANGADRFCMGAAWRQAKSGEEFDRVLDMVRGVKELGLEACATLGMVDEQQAKQLEEAGLDYYNHNLDTGRSHYSEVITTRTYDDRLDTLQNVRKAGMKVCCGGILGLGEKQQGRAELLCELANLDPPPESVPINTLVQVEGTPFAKAEQVDWSDLVRTVAAARILMPKSVVRLSAGRTDLDESAQAMCFLAGANSMFVGDELLTTPNPSPSTDAALLKKLGLNAVAAGE
jgi:biotin synthase